MAIYRAAVIGCGRMGGFIDDEVGFDHPCALPYSHGLSYVESPRTELVAACDADEAKLKAWGERYGVEALYASVAAMMDAEKPDIVSVCTPTAPRCEVTLEALSGRPKALWIEKPMAATLGECDRMLQAARKVGAVIAINTSRSWHPIWVRARELIEREWTGPVRSIAAYCPGGISHMGSHLLDTVRMLVGDTVEWVTGHAHDEERLAGEDDLPLLGLLHFRGGTHAYVNMIDTGGRVECDIIGERGRIRVWNNGAEADVELPAPEQGARHFVTRPFPRPARMPSAGLNVIEDLVRCIEAGGEPRASGGDGRHVLEIALAMRESARQGGAPVRLPFEDLTAAIRSA
jgi:predicted dehydrogenase